MPPCKHLFFFFAFFGILTPTFAQNPIGVNLASFRDWSSEYVFKDAFKMCREWTQVNATTSEEVAGLVIPLRADGYPQSLPVENAGVQLIARTYVLTGQVHPLPEGDYTLIAEGTGTVRIRQSGGSGWQTLNSPGMLSFPKETDGHFFIDILQSDPADPVHNIRLILPGFMDSYETEPYHPDFVDFLEPFQCIRFMDWMRTNGSTIAEWEHRTPADYYSQTVPFAGNVPYRGVAYEYLFDLCNTLGKDAWVNIPHMAGDGYIEQFATFMRDHLDAGLKIYLEYSNEVWNTAPAFPQSAWVTQQGQAMGYPEPDANQRALFTAKRSADVFRIFEEVFGSESDRLVKVLAGQAGNQAVAETILNAFLNNLENVNPTGEEVDALAIAPYFGNFINAAVDVEDVLDQAVESMETLAFPRIDNHQNMLTAHGWNIPLIAYEGGQHLDGNSPALDALFCEANRHEGMGELYCTYFNYWYEQGGGLFMHYNSTSSCGASGSWGLKEYTGQPDAEAPKYRAILDCVVTGVNEPSKSGQTASVEIFPNPSTGLLQVRLSKNQTFDKAEIFDLQGRLRITADLPGLSIDLSSLSPGMYILVVKNEEKVVGRGEVVKE